MEVSKLWISGFSATRSLLEPLAPAHQIALVRLLAGCWVVVAVVPAAHAEAGAGLPLLLLVLPLPLLLLVVVAGVVVAGAGAVEGNGRQDQHGPSHLHHSADIKH
jgi:hypothetical protein